MKLSEAIRLGATMKPQAFGHFFDGRGTCALGAAADAVGNLRLDETDAMKPWFNPLHEAVPPCVKCTSWTRDSLQNTIIHWNDDHRLSREEIADLVELQEPIDSTSPPEELPDPIPSPEEEPSKVA